MFSHLYLIIDILFFAKITCEIFRSSNEEISQQTIQQIFHGISEINCVLRCQLNERCSKIAHQKASGSIIGDCFSLTTDGSDGKVKGNPLRATVYYKVCIYVLHVNLLVILC